ncbi:hypothetical protein [Actinoplanes awajinensis]|uniref:hypothetical protein n=1 Tax=Actinoplanes awajinensis TaxID=135946 RepID=UPI000ACC0D0F|nr:hypothetical protein [Actinoplanes awajinensis]
MMTTVYRGRIHLIVLLTLALSVAVPVIAVVFPDVPWWQRVLAPLTAVPLLWFYTLRELVYRLELTDTELRLRALLGRWRIPLADLASIGAPTRQNLVSVKHRDGRSWNVLAGPGLVDFADRVGAAAPNARVGINGWQRTTDRAEKFFEREQG